MHNDYRPLLGLSEGLVAWTQSDFLSLLVLTMANKQTNNKYEIPLHLPFISVEHAITQPTKQIFFERYD